LDLPLLHLVGETGVDTDERIDRNDFLRGPHDDQDRRRAEGPEDKESYNKARK